VRERVAFPSPPNVADLTSRNRETAALIPERTRNISKSTGSLAEITTRVREGTRIIRETTTRVRDRTGYLAETTVLFAMTGRVQEITRRIPKLRCTKLS
jgi:hypothetical protein